MKVRRVVLILSVLACLALAGALAECRPARHARVTATPTKTPRPTFTATLVLPTATDTPLPTATPLPTEPPAPTALPTFTPLPVATFTAPPPPTSVPPPTARPLPTATRRPAPRPTAKPTPRPTNTPAPPFKVDIAKGYARCDGYRGVTGFVYHANKTPYPDVAVAVWSDLWDGQVVISEASGKFDVNLSGQPFGKFYVAVVRLETCTRDGSGQAIARSCQVQSNVKEATTTEKCEGTGANQVTELKIYGP